MDQGLERGGKTKGRESRTVQQIGIGRVAIALNDAVEGAVGGAGEGRVEL